MKKFTSVILFPLLLAISNALLAQQNLTLYQSLLTPQRTYCNPAFIPYKKVQVGLPALSSTYFAISNSGFKYSDLIMRGADDSLDVDFNDMLNQLKENNYLTFSTQLDLFNLGIRIKDNYFSL